MEALAEEIALEVVEESHETLTKVEDIEIESK